MCDTFQALGILPSFIDKLNNLQIDRAMLSAVNFSILAEMSSGPLDFETSIIVKIL